MNEADVIQQLQQFIDPYLKQNWYELGWIQDIQCKKDKLHLNIQLPYPAESAGPALQAKLEEHLKNTLSVKRIHIDLNWHIEPKVVQPTLKGLPKIKNIIGIGSAKGGVGKSTTATNMALALKAEGARVGLLDADIYGPNQPSILGVTQARPETTSSKKIQPVYAYNMPTMSIGYLFDCQQPVVWRGPMISKALEQLLNDTLWGELDYLVVDLPPGTGDIQLTLGKNIPVGGAVIITTPQDLAVLDAQKSVKMFDKLNITVLGAVVNMSRHTCEQCGHKESIFGSLPPSAFQSHFDVPLLGELPLASQIREYTDQGKPILVGDPEHEIALDYRQAALSMAAVLSQQKRDYNRKLPNVVLETQ